MGVRDLRTVDEVRATSQAPPKPIRGEQTTRRAQGYRRGMQWFRDEVWKRDGGRSRATGKKLKRVSADASIRGEAAHLRARSAEPGARFNPRNGVLLSAEEHRWSDPRTAGASGRRLLIIEPASPNTELRGDRALTFIRVDHAGRELWRYTSEPQP